jgi:hypothetical protein
MPKTAGIPRATDDVSRQAESDFLNWMASLNQWGQDLFQRQTKFSQSPTCQ